MTDRPTNKKGPSKKRVRIICCGPLALALRGRGGFLSACVCVCLFECLMRDGPFPNAGAWSGTTYLSHAPLWAHTDGITLREYVTTASARFS